MSDSPPDPRVLRSERMLQDALLELLKEKPFRAITVRAISERAGLNRSTFYAHFRDRYELLGRCTLAGWNILREGDARLEHPNHVQLATQLNLIALDFLERNRELGLVALREMHASPYLADFRRALVDSAVLWVRSLDSDVAPVGMDAETTARFIVGGSVEVFIHWLASGMVEPAETVAARLTALIVGGVSGALQVDEQG